MTKYDFEFIKFKELSNIRIFAVELGHCHFHAHKEMEICYVLSGRVHALSSDGDAAHNAGELILFNSKQAHELFSDDNKPTVILTFQFSPAILSFVIPRVEHIEFQKLDLSAPDNASFSRRLVNRLLFLALTFFAAGQSFELNCFSQVLMIYSLLMNGLPWALYTEAERMALQKRFDRIFRIMEYIDSNYLGRLRLSDIARKEGLSMNYLSHFFKNETGISFQEYVLQKKLEKALHLLKRTDLSITEIALQSGFCDCRQLRSGVARKYGCALEEFREASFPSNREDRESADFSQRFLPRDEAYSLVRGTYLTLGQRGGPWAASSGECLA